VLCTLGILVPPDSQRAFADGIGQRWEVLNNAYKPYPCGVVLFPVINACLEVRAHLAPETEAIDRVVVRGHPLSTSRTLI